MNFRTLSIAAVTVAGLSGFAALPAYAEVINMSADLTSGAEVPPNDSTASGKLEATYDTDSMELNWTVTYEGLTGPATAAHFHGPAEPGANAGPVVPIEGDLASPIKGSATLTEEQAGQLQDGMWYFNLHTEAHSGGEIRGQVEPASAM